MKCIVSKELKEVLFRPPIQLLFPELLHLPVLALSDFSQGQEFFPFDAESFCRLMTMSCFRQFQQPIDGALPLPDP